MQIYYAFDEKGLLNVKLCYYPKPAIINVDKMDVDTYVDFSFDERLKEIYYILSELIGYEFDISNTTHIRFDFDRNVESHSKNHLQISGISDIRITSYFILYPFHFVDFIIKNVLPNEYLKFYEKEDYRFLLSESYKLLENDKIVFEDSSLILTLNK